MDMLDSAVTFVYGLGGNRGLLLCCLRFNRLNGRRFYLRCFFSLLE